jgi:hypothetical protein
MITTRELFILRVKAHLANDGLQCAWYDHISQNYPHDNKKYNEWIKEYSNASRKVLKTLVKKEE